MRPPKECPCPPSWFRSPSAGRCGGLSILLGYRAKLGAWLIVIFLVSHRNDSQTSGHTRSDDGASPHGHVMKNISMLAPPS